MRVLLLGGLTLAAAAVLLLAPVHRSQGTSILSSDPATIDQGRQLFAEHCRPCHGESGVGQNPDRPIGGLDATEMHLAPALNGTGHSWHHPPQYLVETVREGTRVENSAMAGWRNRLSDWEILAVIAYFQSLWPEHVRRGYRRRYLGQIDEMP